MNWDILQGVVRHLLTLGAGWIVAKGIFDQSAADAAVGAVMTLIGVGWSVYDKKPK